MHPYRQLLVPVDGSPTARKALDEAIRLARLARARIRIVHVIDELAWANGYETAATLLNDVVPLMRAAGLKLLADDCTHVTEAGIRCDKVLVESPPGRVCELVAIQAAACKADLIVVGSHGRRGTERFFMGSDAEQIVRHAPVPVLVIRG